jgi:hypothetical protein
MLGVIETKGRGFKDFLILRCGGGAKWISTHVVKYMLLLQ